MHNSANKGHVGAVVGMSTAGWLDVWHLVVAIVVRQPPFAQVMFATGGVFLAVMALEGIRSSVAAMWRAHKQVPLAPPQALQPPHGAALAMTDEGFAAKNISAKGQRRLAAAAARRPKPLTLSPRQFRSPRPKIRRHPKLQFEEFSMLPENAARAALDLRDAL